MAELRLLPIRDVLSDAQVKALNRKLKELGIGPMPRTDESLEIEDPLSDDQLADFLDRLEAHEIACDIYLPLEFEGRIEAGDGQLVGSAQTLIEALDEIRDELAIDEEEALEDEEALDLEVIEAQLAYAWNVFAKAANACLEHQIPLHVIS